MELDMASRVIEYNLPNRPEFVRVLEGTRGTYPHEKCRFYLEGNIESVIVETPGRFRSAQKLHTTSIVLGRSNDQNQDRTSLCGFWAERRRWASEKWPDLLQGSVIRVQVELVKRVTDRGTKP